LKWTARIRSWGERGEEGGRPPEGEGTAAAPPLPRRGGHRRNPTGRYGVRFCDPKTPGERGEQGELDPGLGKTRDAPELPRQGRRRRATSASVAGGASGPPNARQKDGEGAGKETKLTTARIRSENDEVGQGRQLRAAEKKTSATASLRKAERSEDREKENGKGGKKARAHGGFLQLKPRRGGGNVGGAGRGLVVFQLRERKERGGGWGKMKLTGGPGLLAGRERGRGRGRRLGRGPGRRGRAQGFAGPPGRKEEGEEKFLFIFQTNFQCIFQMDF